MIENIKNKFVKSSKKFFSARAFLILLGFSLVAVSVFLWRTQASRNLAQIISSTESKARHYASETEIRYNSIHQALERLVSRGAPRNEKDIDEWAKDAAFYIDAFTGIKSIAWVDETYHIRQIVPLQDNLPYINQSASEINGDSSDVNLWVPVYDGEEFTGYVIGTIDIDAFISPVLNETNDDYMLQLSDEGTVIFKSANWNPPQEGFATSKIITFENTTVLDLTFAPTEEFLDTEIGDTKKTLTFGLLFSFITISAVYFAQKYNVAAAISETHYRDLFDASQDAIFIINLKGEYQDANPAALEMIGYSLTEIHQMRVSDLRFQAEKLPSDEQLQMWAKDSVREMPLRHKNGQAILVELAISPIKEEGIQKSVLGIARDITERVRAEEALQESEKRLRLLVQNIPIMIDAINAEGNFVLWNQECELVTGYSAEEIIENPKAMKFLYPNIETLNQVKTEISEHTVDYRDHIWDIKHKDGSTRTVSWANISKQVSIPGWEQWAIGTDVTDRVKAEKERISLETQLRQHQKLEAIGTLASGVAHEINNPLTGIMNYAQLIYDRIDPAEDRLCEFSAGIIDETERVAEIVRNLLTFSRQDRQIHRPARIDDILDKTLSLIRTIIKRDQITLEVDVPDNLPTIKCRSQQIQQVIMNLLTNARDALNERYPEYDPNKICTLTVRPFEKDGQHWLRTTIEDRGMGIPAKIRERIFDPFYTSKDRTRGTGLGLSISLGIVQDHHGKLTFESEKNQFTRFHLDLPIDKGSDVEG